LARLALRTVPDETGGAERPNTDLMAANCPIRASIFRDGF
jgi:hypothetical protein